MFRRRFFFGNYDGGIAGRDVDAPSEVLKNIFDYAETYGLIEHIPAGKRLFRARWQECIGQIRSPKNLGPPPRDKATQSNRMSPPGIVVFYGSDHLETALRETAVAPGRFAVGQFETIRPMTLLDLTRVPAVPSLFRSVSDSAEVRPRKILKFLNHIAEEISKPIARDDREHIEYIPTQIVTEYVRSRLTRKSDRVDGIKYPSSLRHGYSSYVLFATQDNIVSDMERDASDFGDGPEEKWLRLSGHRECSVTEKDRQGWQN